MMNYIKQIKLLLIFALIAPNVCSTDTEERRCADDKCEEIISLGVTIKNYSPSQEGVLGFRVGSDVKIKSKSSNPDSDLWGVEIDGKDGYAPRIFIQESKVFHRDSTLKPGTPKIAVPPRSKKKLKSSEKQKPSKAQKISATTKTTEPLTKDLKNEKIVSKVDGNQVLSETVNVTPTANVVDGTALPNNADVNVEIKDLFPKDEFVDVNDGKEEEEREQDEDNDDDDDDVEEDDDEDIEDEEKEVHENVNIPSKGPKENSTQTEDLLKPNQAAILDQSENKGTTAVTAQESTASSADTGNSTEITQSPPQELKDGLLESNSTTVPAQPSESTEVKDGPFIDTAAALEKSQEKIDSSLEKASDPSTAKQLPGKDEIVPDLSKPTAQSEVPTSLEKEPEAKIITREDGSKIRLLSEAIETPVLENTNQIDAGNSITNSETMNNQQVEEVKVDFSIPTNNLYEPVPSQPEQQAPNVPTAFDAQIIPQQPTVATFTSEHNQASHIQQATSVPEKPFASEKLIPENTEATSVPVMSATPTAMYENPASVEFAPQTQTHLPSDTPFSSQQQMAGHEQNGPYVNTAYESVPSVPTPQPQVYNNLNGFYYQGGPPNNYKNLNSVNDRLELPTQEEKVQLPAPQALSSNEKNVEAQITQDIPQIQTAESVIVAPVTSKEPAKQEQAPLTDQIRQEVPAVQNTTASDPLDLNESFPQIPALESVTVVPVNSIEPVQNEQAALTNQIAQEALAVQTITIPEQAVLNESISQIPAADSAKAETQHEQASLTYPFPQEAPAPVEPDQTVLKESIPIGTHIAPDILENTQAPYMSQKKDEEAQTIDHPSANETTPESPSPHPTISSESDIEKNAYTNDPQSLEIEDVITPVPTTPDIEDPIPDPIDFYQTTVNPKAQHQPQPPQNPQPQVGLFQTILGTVKNLLPSQDPAIKTDDDFSHELDRILFPSKEVETKAGSPVSAPLHEEFCEKETNCPSSKESSFHPFDEKKPFFDSLSQRVIELFDVLCCMLLSATATLLFIFGYYCLSQCRKESQLIAKLNVVERSLLASHKEASILKHDLGETCEKLASIENNSFGSNDMVIAIKKELEACEEAKAGLEEQVASLEKELENAAEAGLELNKIVSELLNNQSGDESIISSVEELQRQLNEQQHTILEINAVLADKSRENSELQLMLAEQNAKFVGEIASLQQDNDELEGEKNILKTKLEEMKAEFDLDITKALEGKNAEIKRLQADIMELRTKCDDEHRKWQTSLAKVEALENCLKTVKRDPNVKVSQILDVANVQAELLDSQRQRTSLKEKLETETDARKLLEDKVKLFSDEIEKLKQDFNQSEKDKLEAQTRLEVLSNYFKEKENQLQKELSLKETMWLQQQGETTSTVDRLTKMQDEIQTLKSQNDSLRAEIEAQLAAHKAQIGTLENRAHETWLAARQSERKYEEARSDATALRRKLTSLVGSNGQNLAKENNLELNLAPSDRNNAPSPIHMDSPASPMLGRLPPPPFIPPPFMGPPPHFMGIHPFMPPGEMRPPPMGRLMSPPPPPGAPPPHMHRYSPIDDDDDDEDIHDNGRGHWRDTYSPPRHTSYRYSPDRYLYNPELISNYDTETDFSPPPSPRERSHRSGSRSGSYKAYSPPPQSASNQSKDRQKKSSKGHISSGSEKSYDSWKGKSKAMV